VPLHRFADALAANDDDIKVVLTLTDRTADAGFLLDRGRFGSPCCAFLHDPTHADTPGQVVTVHDDRVPLPFGHDGRGRGRTAALPIQQGGGRTLARVVARDALGAGIRSRAAGRRREHQAREDLVRQATTPHPRQSQGPSPAFVRDRLMSLADTIAEAIGATRAGFTPPSDAVLTAAAAAAREAAARLAHTRQTDTNTDTVYRQRNRRRTARVRVRRCRAALRSGTGSG
jgi:hypothetical protein